jgi:hypothetical protein
MLALTCAWALPASAAAAEGGPSLNVPVPATAGGTKAAAPATVTARTTLPAATTGSGVAPVSTTIAPTATAPRTAAATGTAARARPRASGMSGTAIALAAVGVILIACAGAWALVRMRGSDPRWTLSMRHAFAEAAHRTSATAAELADWARLGR